MPFEGGVVGLGRGDLRLEQDPAVDGQPAAVEGLHLVRDGDVGVQVGVAGAGVAVGERRRHQPADINLADALGAGPGEQGVGFDEPERIRDRRLVAPLDRRRGLRVSERPQRRHGLDRGERQVEPGDRGRLRPRQFRDQPGQFASVHGVAAELGPEELPTHLRPDPRPLVGGHGGPAGCALQQVQGGEPFGDLDPQRRHVRGEDLERRPQPGHLAVVGFAETRPVQGVHALLGQRVQAGAEQVLHLLCGDLVAGVQALDASHAGAQPHPGRLAALGVVGRQPDVALLGGVLHGDLPGQVVVP